MEYLISIFLGAIQGITEFLPVSSTAHLILFENLFHTNPSDLGLRFDMFLNIGTLLALYQYFGKQLLEDLKHFKFKPKNPKQKYAFDVLLATALVGVVGILLKDKIETVFREDLRIIAWSALLIGILLIFSDRIISKRKVENSSDIYTVGLSQIIAFIPGVSRSGITILTGLSKGLNRETAAKVAFTLAIPITTIATLAEVIPFLKDVVTGEVAGNLFLNYILGAIASYIVGFAVIKGFMNWVKTHPLSYFGYYRIFLAILIFAYAY